jgi:hypothetical protein
MGNQRFISILKVRDWSTGQNTYTRSQLGQDRVIFQEAESVAGFGMGS